MDVFRIALCLGLVVLLWRLEIRGRRPIRDFFLWGVDYPFHFLLTATLILVIWGVVGAGFGLQGLFLDEDPLTQVLLGATVMLLFAAITVHYVVLGTSRHGWWSSLQRLAGFLRGFNAITDPAHPVQTLLANGFLERLTAADIERIDTLAERERTGAPIEAELREQFEGEPFRLLMSPAILLAKGFGLIVLVGVVPALLIPILDRDPAGCLERLPWLVGVCIGDVLGIILGCWTTAWAADAADWRSHTQSLLASLRSDTDAVPPPRGLAATAADALPPFWLAALSWFFIIHVVVNLVLPDDVTARWIDWPEQTLPGPSDTAWRSPLALWRTIPWLPLGVLAAEIAVAVLAAASLRSLRGGEFRNRLIGPWSTLLSSGVALGLRFLQARWVHRAAWIGAAVIGIASVATTILLSPEATQSVWIGLRGYASLGAMLLCWLGIFWLSTHAAAGPGSRTRAEQRAATVSLGGLGLLHVLAAPTWLLAPLAAAAASISGSRTLAGLRPTDGSHRLRLGLALGIFAAAATSIVIAWAFGHAAVTTGFWLGASILSLGSTALARVAARQPTLLYPLTVLLGFAAFAIPYAGLDERWKSAMPAAGSIACAVALLAAGYTILVFARPRSALLTTVAVAATALLLNGAAFFVAPNEFKGSFPNLDAYYKTPIYLDSRDYFRDTTPSTARLRNRRVTEDFDRLARQGTSERLATVFFAMRPLTSRPDGTHAVTIDVEDPRGRLRAVRGDTIRLAAEEWFTMRIDGADCIALAEEPFYRRIFPWFRYDTLHFIRNGIIRGSTRRLIRDDEPRPAAPARSASITSTPAPSLPTTYRLITGEAAPEQSRDTDVLGLRLLDLASAYTAVGADYALIAMNWVGEVTSARHAAEGDRYTVEFTIPADSTPPDDSQLRTMQSWMERCHLDTLRPAQPATRADAAALERFGLVRFPGERAGDCLVIEDARTDAPVPIGIFLSPNDEPQRRHPAFAPYWPTADAIARTAATAPAPTGAADPAGRSPAERFTLRQAHDRGLFCSPDGAVRRLVAGDAATGQPTVPVALYNAGRLRPGDQLILTWNGRSGSASGPDLAHGAVFELIELDGQPTNDDAADGSLAAGAVRGTLRLVSRRAEPAAGPPADPLRDPFLVGQWQTVNLLNNTEVLLAWKNLVGDRWRDRKPKLVIVTVSGGGIRASVWTSVVLRKLEATLGADFPYHIRLVTGASGGMVAGSYYAASLVPPPEHVLRGGRADFADLHGTSIEQFVDRMATDQLDAVAGRMLFADLPAALSPLARHRDRGRTLESTWIRWTGGPASPLGRPLQSYAADERLGWRPSLVYTPMMVEDGRRLLISNLDLAFATRNVGGLLLEPSSRKIDRPAFQGGDFDLSIHEEDEVFSLSAVEFFRLFPQAHDFRVSTAIRMSASFPWVSPAINLPTLPPRRVVDAAYYDNYGVNLSALWLSKLGGWLQANTSGVLVVQVRDKVSQGARTEIDFDRLSGTDSLLDRLVWHGGSQLIRPGLQAIATPLVGVTNARNWTMAFRNDEQVDLQDLLFDELSGRDFFRTVVFECPVDVSLNWKLTAHEKAILIGGFGRPDANPDDELARVRDYLTGRDSYEFHKWRIDNRNSPTFQRDLKERYDRELRALGIAGTERLTVQESQSLYENVIKNLKRLELLADWWETGRTPVTP
jgi:hypothetical protein